MAFVVDASVAMAWCFEDESTPSTEQILDRLRVDEAHVPPIWSLEVANVLLAAERKRRIPAAKATRFIELLTRLPIHIREQDTATADVLHAGRRTGLSSYDCAYLLLAERSGIPLATTGQQLAAAARAGGIPLLI